jgi:sporulation protein YlmC with PRC-barrel domain
MIAAEQAERLVGARVLDRDGQDLGRVGDIYLEEDAPELAWVVVTAEGVTAGEARFVPLHDARLTDEGVVVAVAVAAVEAAPDVATTGDAMSDEDEDALRRHYRLETYTEDATVGPGGYVAQGTTVIKDPVLGGDTASDIDTTSSRGRLRRWSGGGVHSRGTDVIEDPGTGETVTAKGTDVIEEPGDRSR